MRGVYNQTIGQGIAVRADGVLVGWGEDVTEWGEEWNGAPVELDQDVAAVCGSVFSVRYLLLKNDGALWSWGANFSGGLGFEGGNKKHREGFSAETAYDIYYQDVPRKIDMTDVLDAYVGATTYLLKRDGSLWAAGSNYGDARCIMGGTDNSPEGFNKIMDGVKLPEGVAPATTPSTQTGAGFTDVKTSEYWYKPILWAVENGITNGTSATAFSPNQTCSRAHIVTFLYRAEGSPSKTGNGEWYDDAANWANRGGLLAGTAEAFRPGADCPRADVVYYLWRDLAK